MLLLLVALLWWCSFCMLLSVFMRDIICWVCNKTIFYWYESWGCTPVSNSQRATIKRVMSTIYGTMCAGSSAAQLLNELCFVNAWCMIIRIWFVQVASWTERNTNLRKCQVGDFADGETYNIKIAMCVEQLQFIYFGHLQKCICITKKKHRNTIFQILFNWNTFATEKCIWSTKYYLSIVWKTIQFYDKQNQLKV